MKVGKDYYSATEVIRLLGLSSSQFHSRVEKGTIPSFQPPGKTYKWYPKAEVDALAANKDPQPGEAETPKDDQKAFLEQNGNKQIANVQERPRPEKAPETRKEQGSRPLVSCPPHQMQITSADIRTFYFCPKCALCFLLRVPPTAQYSREPPGEPYWQQVGLKRLTQK
jgi:hypothetical protein